MARKNQKRKTGLNNFTKDHFFFEIRIKFIK